MMKVRALLSLLVLAATAQAHPGVGIVRDAHGNIFYTDLTHVWRIPAGGGKPAIAVPHVHTHELCFDAQGALLGEHLWYNGESLNTWGHRVWRLAPDGRLTDLVPARAGFRTTVSFVRDGAGNEFFHERTAGGRDVFKRKAPDGTISTLLDSPRFHDIRWMTAAPGGTLYFVDQSDLWRLAPDGQIKLLARRLAESDAAEQRHMVQGLCADDAGNVWVAVYELRVVKKITADGTTSIAARASFPWAPTGVLATPDDGLWLLEGTFANQVRVRHLGRDGKITTY
jgi:sugar lactone lactonase YvrE